MSPTNPTLTSTLTQLSKGDQRLKRLAVSIVTKHHPEDILSGYALVTELNDKVLSFFSTQKFMLDEILTVRMFVDSDEMEFKVRMSHHHEQISSGRIMNAIPTAENPFPARKFYRCFAQVMEVKQNGVVLTNNVTEIKPAETAATGLEAVPTPVETGEGELKAA